MRNKIVFVILIVFGFVFANSYAEQFQFDFEKLTFTKGVKTYTLKNGLKVLIKEEHSVPLVGFAVAYKVGFRNEDVNGKSGLTHLLEHMMFKGTKDVGKGEFSRIMSELGARFNAYTSYNRTVYWEILPVAGIETAIKLEADRMVNALLDPEEFEKEKCVIYSEVSKMENNPATKLKHRLYKEAFGKHPFRYMAGTLEDITNADRKYVYNELYKRYYAPNNAYIILVGDVDENEGLALIKKYFGDIESGKNLPSEKPIPLPKKKNIHVDMEGVASEDFGSVIFHLPAVDVNNKDFIALSFIDWSSMIVGFNYWALIDGGLGFMQYSKEPDYPSETIDADYVTKTFCDFKKKIFNQERMDYDSIENYLMILIYIERYGDYKIYDKLMKAFNELTPADINRVIKKYLTRDNSVSGFFEAKKRDKNAKPQSFGDMHDDFTADLDFSKIENPSPEDISKAKKYNDELFPTTIKSLKKYLDTAKEVKLDNGITVIYRPFSMSDNVSISLGLKAGYIHQKKVNQAGYTYDFVFGGGPQIRMNNKLAKLGIKFGGGVQMDYTSFSVFAPTENFDDAIDMIGLALKNRKFIPLILEEKKFNTINSLEKLKNNPSPQAHAPREINKMIFGKAGSGLDVYAQKSDILKVSIKDIDDFYKTFYRPENMIIVVVGNIDFDTVLAKIKSQLGDWKQTPAVLDITPADLLTPKKETIKRIVLDSKQSVVMMAAPTVDYSDTTNYTTYLLANDIFGGGGLTSRLMRSIRDKEGLTYHIGTYPWPYGRKNMFRLYMQTSPKDVDKAIAMYKQELKRYKKDGPSELEILKFKTTFLNSAIFGYETSSKIAGKLLYHKIRRGNIYYDIDFFTILNGVDKSGLMEVVRKYFPDEYFIVIAGK